MGLPRVDEVEVELLQEVRQLALDMIRLETWAREAHARGRWNRVGELHTARDQARERRSALMRQIWNARHPRHMAAAVL